MGWVVSAASASKGFKSEAALVGGLLRGLRRCGSLPQFALGEAGMSEMTPLKEQPYYPYPRDPAARFGFIVGDIISWSIIILIVYIALKPTFHF